MKQRIEILCSLSLACFSTAVSAVDYQQEIAPILRTYCAGCHNESDYEGDFSLETYAGLREGGENKGDPIAPGNSAKSYLIGTIDGSRRPLMPPKDEPRPSEDQVALLKKWIDEGAKGPKDDRSLFASLEAPDIKVDREFLQPITALATTVDGRLVAEARYTGVQIRTAKGGKTLHRFTDLPGKVAALSFSRDHRQLIAATGITGLSGTAIVWDVATGEKLHELSGHRDLLYDAVFSPDGKTIATAGYDQKIRLWDASLGKLQRTISGHNAAILDLAFHPSGELLASASADETVKLWRVKDGLRLDTLNQPQGRQRSVAFTPDGKHVVAGGADSKIRLWRLLRFDKPRIQPIVHSRYAHEDAIEQVSISGSGKQLVSVAADGTLKRWSLPGLVEEHLYEEQPDSVTAVSFRNGSNEFIVSRMDGSIKEYTLIEGQRRALGNESSSTKPSTEKEAVITDREAVVHKGLIEKPSASSTHAFTAKAGEEIILEINAAKANSKLDSRIEVLDSDGELMTRTVLQAVRDSWVTFRGKNSTQANDFRIHNWEEMELGEYLYLNGEVVRLHLYPRGPDSGFNVFPGFGTRHGYFGTSGLTHALGEPCYIVEAHAPDADIPDNGLPRYTIFWENDDDPMRKLGADSRLHFVAPADGDYQVRVSDTRGFGGKDHHYELTVRSPKPDFGVSLTNRGTTVSPGSGKEFGVNLDRKDGYQGPVKVEFGNLPPGITIEPVIVEAEQYKAVGVIRAAQGITPPVPTDPPAMKDGKPVPPSFPEITATATATVRGQAVEKPIAGGLGKLIVGGKPKVTIEILPGSNPDSFIPAADGRPLTLVIERGGTLQARLRVVRDGHDGEISFGKEDAGRNLPFGTIVDNIGLNGLLLLAKQNERDFFLRTAPFAPVGDRLIHLRSNAADKGASAPVILRVVDP